MAQLKGFVDFHSDAGVVHWYVLSHFPFLSSGKSFLSVWTTCGREKDLENVRITIPGRGSVMLELEGVIQM